MARYTGAKLRITRRLGDLPGLTSKKPKLTQRPGQHGATQKKLTQYAIRLEEKQKLRFISSNQERMSIPNILGKNYLKIMIIRDPISRIQSYYFQAKKMNKTKHDNNKSQDIRKPYMLAADKYDINDFIKYLYNERPFIVSNPNCICLSGTQDFLTAKKIIDSEFFLAAPIEQLDDFLQLINIKLFQGEYKKNFKEYNLGMNNPQNLLISKELIEKIKLTNKADIDLKKHIELEFNDILNDQKNVVYNIFQENKS